MGFMSGEYIGHSRTGIPLYSMNVLVILELLQGPRLCIKIYPFCGTTTHSHESVFRVITMDTIVVFAANRMRNIMLCIQTTIKLPVSVQVWGAISNRDLSFPRKLNGNMDSAKYQGDVIHDIKMVGECVMFPQKEYIFVHGLVPCHTTKSTRTFLECQKWPGNSPDINPIENVSDIMQK